ncbi:hypothetical protein Acr_18g0000080 [Actinidia rufa]|uniref:Uncharacterized protein n=1 Tax=Actinidia rufa TaxID=165716 RepID=A0A7J0G4X5_9ERIC|nr:hypothetical protein Acr_18g0000080 [Actinidia rufa]
MVVPLIGGGESVYFGTPLHVFAALDWSKHSERRIEEEVAGGLCAAALDQRIMVNQFRVKGPQKWSKLVADHGEIAYPPPSHHPWPIGAPARPVEGHRAKRKPFEVKSTLIGVESSLVKSVSKQISHSHSPHRRLTVGSAFPTRSGEFPTRLGRVSDELPRKKRRFAVLREIRHHFARFLQLRV